MKKFLFLCLSLVAVLGVTGCGERTLTCSMTENEGNFEITSKTEISYDSDDSIEEVKVVVDIIIPEEYASQKSNFVDTYKEIYGEKATVVETKDGVRVTITGDESLMNDIKDDDEDVSYDALKKVLTNEGYSCE